MRWINTAAKRGVCLQDSASMFGPGAFAVEVPESGLEIPSSALYLRAASAGRKLCQIVINDITSKVSSCMYLQRMILRKASGVTHIYHHISRLIWYDRCLSCSRNSSDQNLSCHCKIWWSKGNIENDRSQSWMGKRGIETQRVGCKGWLAHATPLLSPRTSPVSTNQRSLQYVFWEKTRKR